ncbi:MAG: flagellar filament capping protein FliD [Phycisphaerae bacterium]
MSGISSGIGLISGLPTADLINQLIALERRPIDDLQNRVEAIDVQRAAFLELSAQMLAAQSAIASLGRNSLFNRFTSSSTNESILTASAGATATPGVFTFGVRSLAAAHSVISRAVAGGDQASLGAGTLTIESVRGRVNPATALDALNGGAGVRRGMITIRDRAGGSADIDLTTATTVGDVLDAINSDSDINVRASVTGLASGGAAGDRIVLEDLTDPSTLTGTERLTVTDQGGGFAAADLGLVGSATAGRIDGSDLVRLTTATPLAFLNDGNGVDRLRAGTDLVFTSTNGDFNVSLTNILSTQPQTDLRILNGGHGVRLGVIRITDRAGDTADVDLTAAQTIGDVRDAINAAGVAVSARLDESSLVVADTSDLAEEIAGSFSIEDVSGFAAADLGLAQAVDGDTIRGGDVYRIATLGDVINAINFAAGNSFVEASLDASGKGISLRSLGVGNTVTVGAGVGSGAAEDLGILDATVTTSFSSRRLVAGLNTVLLRSLNGGQGVSRGTVSFTDRAGASTTIDFADAETLQDVIDLINADTATGLVASVNASGNGIMLEDRSGGTNAGAIISGALADDLGFSRGASASVVNGNVINGGDAQLQYVARGTALSSLGAGRGVAAGSFQITDSNGAVFAVVVNENLRSVGEVIDQINAAAPVTIQARINDTGDGIVVIDTAGGNLPLTIEERDGGTTAGDLRLAGTAASGEDRIDGSFQIRIDIDADDTLSDVAGKINSAGGGATASVLTHGGTAGFVSLSIVSGLAGRRGEMVIDTQGVDLGFSTLARAQDAVVTLGDPGAVNPPLLSSPSNTVEGVVRGVSLNLVSAGDEAVTVTVAQDVDAIAGALNSFVSSYNQVLDTIDRDTSFNSDTLERGPLLGDSTVSLIRGRLGGIVLRRFDVGDASMSRLFSVGIRAGSGGRLTFDEAKFREVFAESPDVVEELFAKPDTGVSAVLEDVFDQLTRSFDGVIARKDNVLDDRKELLTDRIDRLQLLVDAKRARLEAQFTALESTLAGLQQQQNALAALAQLSS